MPQQGQQVLETYIDRVSFDEEIRDEDIYTEEDKNNPDPLRFVRIENGGYAYKPKQCPKCYKIFTPVFDIQEKCEECMGKHNVYVSKKPVQCDEPGCTVMFIRTSNAQKKCTTKKCLLKRQQAARDKYKENSRPIAHLCPHCHKHIHVSLKSY